MMMNPESSESPDDRDSASILRRGLAYLIDCACAFGVFAASQILLFLPLRNLAGIDAEWFHSGWNTEMYTLVTISIPVWLYFSILDSRRFHGTFGKRIMGIQVVAVDSNAPISFGKSFWRTVLKLIPWELAHLGNNLPVPIWFDPDPGLRIAFLISGGLMLVYLLTILLGRGGRGIYDSICGTMVIRNKSDRQ